MFQIAPREDEGSVRDWLHTTSQKIIAIGAGWKAFLRFTDRVVFTEAPTNVPDQKLIDELVVLLSTGERTTKEG